MTVDRPRVHLLATGGTIANPLDIDGYLSGEALVDEVPEVGQVAEVAVTDVAATGSSGMTPEIWWALHDEIEMALARDDPPDGFVITHGSNTVEETAFFLHLTLATERPVVLTAAQRNHRLVGNDGDRNLVDAVKVAADPDARGRGVLVVLNDEIHAARDVRKVASGRPDAWSSGNLGVLGLIDKRDNRAFLRRPTARGAPDRVFDVADADPADLPRVEIVYSAAGDDGTLAQAAVDSGARGLVLAALPTGSPADPVGYRGQAGVLDDLIDEGVPVVLSHRGVEGWPYPREGYVWGNTLSPGKARILLALALLETDDHDAIKAFFEAC